MYSEETQSSVMRSDGEEGLGRIVPRSIRLRQAKCDGIGSAAIWSGFDRQTGRKPQGFARVFSGDERLKEFRELKT